MDNPFLKNYLWVFELDKCGGVDKVVSVAKSTGYGICAKYHDGNPADDAKFGFKPNFLSLMEACKRENIPLIAWGYCYGDKYGSLDAEADAAIEVLQAGAEGYVIDAEIEWEVTGSDDWAKRFCKRILAKVPDAKLAYAPFWNMTYHLKYPAKGFSESGCVAVMPQVYFGLGKKITLAQRTNMYDTAIKDFSPYGLPVCPIGEFPGVPFDGVLDFLKLSMRKPHSFWLLDGYQDNPYMYLLDLLNDARKTSNNEHEETLNSIRSALKVLRSA